MSKARIAFGDEKSHPTLQFDDFCGSKAQVAFGEATLLVMSQGFWSVH